MKRIWTVIACLFLGAGALAPAAASEGQEPFGWLAGCWITGSGATREVWAAEGDGLLFGYTVATRNGRIGFFEQLRLEKTAEGWVFFAYPRGVGPVRFGLVSQGPQTARFENTAHDFPQRIDYARDGDRLVATVALANGDREQRWSYTVCDGAR